ncbi:flavin monoamine oxidase family protein [Sphingomonas sp. BIUV-7]|uniref:Tryptophan 2-monooxygenase n=1 Tax=Sphingomonas natans TaxID=3063330 RepID=A0ABT8YA04_9SPHN|nr:flavin monoamine oxidase family protein [Sphingomonas sp. BIUV-7]MDO6415172.1 flavin monoamine oxidase family protein [Sphingomonas sp. BIUV-7]
MRDELPALMSRRSLFSMIGKTAGIAVMYEAMATMAYAADSTFRQPIALTGAPKGSSVLILGAGLAGMVAAYELGKAGYKVQILEYQGRPGGRNWSLYGGDTYTELGGFKQNIEFDKGLYLNPGPWRIPHHHKAILHYCQLLGVQLEPFIQINYAAYVHSTKAFGGKPQRYRSVEADFDGYVAELLAKTVQQDKLDRPVTKEDREILLQALRGWGALDKNYAYVKSEDASNRRGFDHPPGGGLDAMPTPTDPVSLEDMIRGRLWRSIGSSKAYDVQQTMFQPVGGMGMIGKAFGKELGEIIRYNAKVTEIRQDKRGVTATFVDTLKGGAPQTAHADWCVCTIPASVLSQIPINVGAPMKAAIDALPYAASAKVGLQMKRRFWEEDEGIYGGITYTDQPNSMISYPSTDFFKRGKGVLLGAYTFGPNAVEFTAMPPEERIAKAVEYGANIHPQYREEFETGATVAWHRVPWTLGCAGSWTEETRAAHYNDICAIDGRIVMAGEHVSMIPAWQEGAVLSSLDAIGRLHKRIVQG